MLLRILNKILRPLGLECIKRNVIKKIDPDFSESDRKIYEKVKSYTMTGIERIMSLLNAVEYVIKNNIDGDIVECGVWKGGSIYAILLKLIEMKCCDRNVYLFDTFEGMNNPTSYDVDIYEKRATEKFKETSISTDSSDWCKAPIEFVKNIVMNAGYENDKLYFIKGKVEDTLPYQKLHKIALLRLDTDWYESTKHELIHLYPLLNKDGVLIIDDYGHWQGARKAVDEFIEEKKIKLLLNRIDYTGRIAIKTE